MLGVTKTAAIRVQLATGFQQEPAGDIALQEQSHPVLHTQYSSGLCHLSAAAVSGTSDPADQEVSYRVVTM